MRNFKDPRLIRVSCNDPHLTTEAKCSDLRLTTGTLKDLHRTTEGSYKDPHPTTVGNCKGLRRITGKCKDTATYSDLNRILQNSKDPSPTTTSRNSLGAPITR